MLSLYDYNQVTKEPTTVKFMGRNITLTKPDYVVSDIDVSFNIIIKNVKLYFHQKYDKLSEKLINEQRFNHFDKTYLINDEPAFCSLFPLIDDANVEIYHLLNRLGVEKVDQNLIDANGDYVKKMYLDEVSDTLEKIYDVKFDLSKYQFNCDESSYSKIIYDNFDSTYDISVNKDLSQYDKVGLFNYYNELFDAIIEKTLHIYRNALLLLVVDYIRKDDESYNDIYNTIMKKDFINSFYKVETTKNFARSMVSNIFKYPFVAGNYYRIVKFVEEDDFEAFKVILDYLGITSDITETMNYDNHNFMYNNFNLDSDIDLIKKEVRLYCYLSGENIDTYIARHMLIIQKEEIDKLLYAIDNEGDIRRLDALFEQVSEKNRKFEALFNRSCMSPSEMNALDRKVNEQKSLIRQENYYRTILFIVLIGFVFYEAYKLLQAGF